jgi:6-pyruvoyltetrahydropterin/6-carboxytetrahydropterin synthase
MYKLSVKAQISGAHSLRNYQGNCSRMHGHNWKIVVDVLSERLDEIGMGVDFGKLTAITRRVTDLYDHQNINEVSPFDQMNPTAENMARHFYHEIGKLLPQGSKIAAVRVWETEDYMVEYVE